MATISRHQLKEIASALWQLADKHNLVQRVFGEMHAVEYVFVKNPALLRRLTDSSITFSDRRNILEQALKQVLHPFILNTLLILIQRHLLKDFSSLKDIFEQMVKHKSNHHLVKVTSATPLKDKDKHALVKILETKLSGTIELQETVDIKIYGGLIVDIDHLRIDASLKGKIDRLNQQLSQAQLVNS